MSNTTNLFVFIALVLLCSTATAESFDIVRPDKEAWNCVDYSISYSRENPEWGLVSLSNNQLFQGESHLVNYRIDEVKEKMYIHDGLYNLDYGYELYKLDADYNLKVSNGDKLFFHFYQSEDEVKRNYDFLVDNRHEVLNYNLSSNETEVIEIEEIEEIEEIVEVINDTEIIEDIDDNIYVEEIIKDKFHSFVNYIKQLF